MKSSYVSLWQFDNLVTCYVSHHAALLIRSISFRLSWMLWDSRLEFGIRLNLIVGIVLCNHLYCDFR